MIAQSAIIYPHVVLGKNVTIEDFCIIGVPNAFCDEPTEIGDNAVIRSHTVIYAGNKIGSHFSCGNKVNLREKNQIGSNVSIGTHSVIEHHTVILDHTRIHTNVFIPEFSHIEENCWIGPHVVLTNAKYPNQPDTKNNLAGPFIGKNTIIGASTTILPGVKIGTGSFIGAKSLVVKNVPDHSLCYGHPAKVRKEWR